jgi:hypothetical protein
MEAEDLTSMDMSRATWKKSSHSGDSGGNCVEVTTNLPGAIAIRDSKNPHGSALTFTPSEWSTFLSGIKLASSTD